MSDSRSGPRLAVVAEPTSRARGDRDKRPSAPESETLAPGSRRPGRTRTLLWLAALVWLAVLLVYEFRYAGQLEVRVEELSAELVQAREALGVYQRRMGRVRRGLDELVGRVEALQELVREGELPASGSTPQAGDQVAFPSSEGPAGSSPVRPSSHRAP